MIATKTWTIDEIRSDLANELRFMRKMRKRYPEPESQKYYAIVEGYIKELGYNLYERPERKHRR